MFGKLDAKEKKAADKGNGKAPKKPQAKKARVVKVKPLQAKADLLELAALEADEEDDINTAMGPRSGDAFTANQRGDADRFSDLLDTIANGRRGKHNDGHLVSGIGETDAVFVPPETMPPSLNGQDDPDAIIRYVSKGFVMWLNSLHEFDQLEIDVVPAIVEKENIRLPTGTNLDIIHVVRWIEQHVGVDFNRALIFAAPRVPASGNEPLLNSKTPNANISLFDESVFTTFGSPDLGLDAMDIDENGTAWIDKWMIDKLSSSTTQQLGSHSALTAHLQPLVLSLDFILDDKSVFYVRFVYMAFAPISEKAEAHLNTKVFNTPIGHSNVTPFGAFSSAMRFLHLDADNANAKIYREELLKSTDAIKRAGLDGVYMLSNLRAHYVGHYYHTPQESFTNETNDTINTINKEFVITS